MRLIQIPEQKPKYAIPTELTSELGVEQYQRLVAGNRDEEAFFYRLTKQADGSYVGQTSYYVGVDWIDEKTALQVRPKLEDESGYIDCLKMLNEALQEPDNAEHLDGLLTVDFNAKPIPLSLSEDLLSPFLVAQFILALKKAVRKGLRQSYYMVTENLTSKVKGKIQVAANIRQNLSKKNIVDNVCRYQEYGVNSEENKILKKALKVASRILTNYRGGFDVEHLKKTIATIKPYFREVGDDYDLSRVKNYRENPIFGDYYTALKYGILILKHSAYGYNRDSSKTDSTPPYWIDMSRLFELYVFKELRRHYSAKELTYQFRTHWRALDYLLDPEDGRPMVIDAKYKPRYHYEDPEIDDLRQISAYARMEGVYKKLGIEEDRLIDCLIIYANQACEDQIPGPFSAIALTPVSHYRRFFKIGISLPVRQ